MQYLGGLGELPGQVWKTPVRSGKTPSGILGSYNGRFLVKREGGADTVVGDYSSIVLNDRYFRYDGTLEEAFSEAVGKGDYLGIEVLSHEMWHGVEAYLRLTGKLKRGLHEGTATVYGKFMKHYVRLLNNLPWIDERQAARAALEGARREIQYESWTAGGSYLREYLVPARRVLSEIGGFDRADGLEKAIAGYADVA